MISLLLAAAVVVVLCWPQAKPVAGLLFPASVLPPPPAPPAPPAQPRGVSYEAALRALAQVRSRLAATQSLTDKERAAVDALTLALVNGSGDE
jgi:hypothetical protein